MPERVARTSPNTMVTEYVGSGPFRFLPREWDAGNFAAYARFDGYVPRPEPPQWFAGGKVAKFDRVEWVVQPDPATAAAALQRNEVDWVEQPLIDLVGSLKRMRGVEVASYDKLGLLAMVVVNHLHPPFDKPGVLRAILAATNQQDCVEAAIGDQAELGVAPVGFFVDGSPLASKVGLDRLGPAKDIEGGAGGHQGGRL